MFFSLARLGHDGGCRLDCCECSHSFAKPLAENVALSAIYCPALLALLHTLYLGVVNSNGKTKGEFGFRNTATADTVIVQFCWSVVPCQGLPS